MEEKRVGRWGPTTWVSKRSRKGGKAGGSALPPPPSYLPLQEGKGRCVCARVRVSLSLSLWFTANVP